MASAADFPAFQSPGDTMKNINGGSIASAATLPTPTGFITVVTGTTQTTLIPLPYPDFEGMLIFIPTGAWTGATGGTATAANRALAAAFVGVANIPILAFYNKATGFWYVASYEAET